ncbi:MAG: McrC family protein [Clostridium sp.]|uniref:McrC family protein n=1 Tax=Clostridium sp. TaxID=1506 RepID=UPI0029012710|nr:McrC family protein [Clostridium sp.]MDU1937485.1 McrC family protein [Clostridium sp.]MDU1979638.1 McrC family protein [Clostridium sp.]MDU1995268.1 McrC family protein [Clostridium sp.]MDU2045917.1 McrC family protein [Clostridium sp.]MDU6049692.1 McrC family protein [Clostridium sp.]
MRNITIQECFESLKIGSNVDCKTISQDEADELSEYIKSNLDRDNFIWGRDTITIINYVGYIKLSTVSIEILPKVSINNNSPEEGRKTLLNMLAKCGMIKVNYSEINNLNTYKMSLDEILAYLFAIKLQKELSKGPYQEYISTEENIGTLKGKLMVNQQIKNIASAKPKAFCRYEEFSINNTLNQIFVCCITNLIKRIRNQETIKILRHMQTYFTEVTEREIGNLEVNNYKFTRLNDRFGEAFILAKMLLGGYSSLGSRGNDKAFSILFRMNEVFEKYITKLLYITLEDGVIHPQHSKYKLLVSEDTNKGIFQLKPDIVIEKDGKEQLIIDTKWKRISSAYNRHGVKREDLYQMYAYLTRYKDVNNVILLYPHNMLVLGEENRYHESWLLDDDNNKKIRIYTVNLENEKVTIENLRMIIQSIEN